MLVCIRVRAIRSGVLVQFVFCIHTAVPLKLELSDKLSVGPAMWCHLCTHSDIAASCWRVASDHYVPFATDG